MTTTRENVFAVIDGERRYQEDGIAALGNTRIHEMILGEDIATIQHLVDQARATWYAGKPPNLDAMDLIRKIAGVAVASMERNGAPRREGY
jgi:hypothetical protein